MPKEVIKNAESKSLSAKIKDGMKTVATAEVFSKGTFSMFSGGMTGAIGVIKTVGVSAAILLVSPVKSPVLAFGLGMGVTEFAVPAAVKLGEKISNVVRRRSANNVMKKAADDNTKKAMQKSDAPRGIDGYSEQVVLRNLRQDNKSAKSYSSEVILRNLREDGASPEIKNHKPDLSFAKKVKVDAIAASVEARLLTYRAHWFAKGVKEGNLHLKPDAQKARAEAITAGTKARVLENYAKSLLPKR